MNIPVEKLADAVMDGLKEYASLATDELKASVKKAGQRAGLKVKTW